MKISYFDFEFWPSIDHKSYRVSYTCPMTGKQWTAVVQDTALVKSVMDPIAPTQKAMSALKRFIKTNGGTR